jgi:hypothetical protein
MGGRSIDGNWEFILVESFRMDMHNMDRINGQESIYWGLDVNLRDTLHRLFSGWKVFTNI